MNMLQAIHSVTKGQIIVSCLGKEYNKEILQPKWYGVHYASFNTCGMTKEEYKGEWKVI